MVYTLCTTGNRKRTSQSSGPCNIAVYQGSQIVDAQVRAYSPIGRVQYNEVV